LRVLAAQNWANLHLFHVTTALFHAALPSSYAAAKGARVLLSTGRMRKDIDRRVNETALFVLDVLEKGSFEANGSALPAVLKVRLVHALVRASHPAREAAAGEVPLNQEDLLGALLTFSVVVVRAVRRLGAEVFAADADDYYQLWRTVGFAIGIEEALLPETFEQAERLSVRIAERQFRASDAGRTLTKVLIERIGEHVMFPGLTQHLIRRLAGDRVADLLAVPADREFRKLLSELGGVLPIRRFPVQELLRDLSPVIGQPLLRSIVRVKLNGPAAALGGE